jgi:hypothetical protein
VQICLKEKLEENPEFLNEYALQISKSKKVKQNKVSSLIVNDFVESDNYIRQRLDDKFKNQTKIFKNSKLTKLRTRIQKLKIELNLAEAIYQTMEFSKRND